MKRYTVLVLMMVSAAALFANGTGEFPARQSSVGDPIELSGTLEFVDGHPVLDTGDATYLLGAPRARWYEGELEAGGTMTVEGILQTEPVGPTAGLDVDGHVAVAAATYEGEDLTVADGPMGARGARFATDSDRRGGGPPQDDARGRGPQGSPRGRDRGDAPQRARRS